MKKLALVLFPAFYSFCLFAQSNSSTTAQGIDSNSKWEIGLDLLPLFDTSYSLRNTIIIKKAVSDKRKLRSRIGLSFDRTLNLSNPDSFDVIDKIERNRLSTYISFGEEWYLNHKNYSVFYGVEIFGSYHSQVVQDIFDNHLTVSPPTITDEIDSYWTYETGIKALIGLNIRILPGLFLSPETYLKISYKWERGKYEFYETKDRILAIYGGRTIKRYIVNIEPISAIHLVYKF